MNRLIALILLNTFLLFSTTLDQKIESLNSAPKEQRYKIMNSIKLELIKLNASQREVYLQKLFKEHSANSHTQSKYSTKSADSNKATIHKYHKKEYQIINKIEIKKSANRALKNKHHKSSTNKGKKEKIHK